MEAARPRHERLARAEGGSVIDGGSVIGRVMQFLTQDLWRIRAKDLPRSQSLLIHPLRVVIRAWRGFDENKCRLRASALTFYSLLSMVPVAAMAFGIAKGFGFEKHLQRLILEKLPGQEKIAAQVIAFANKFLDNTSGGLIAGIGVAVLFWTVVQVLGNIEASFNDIWGVRHPRTLMRKLSDYLSIMLICPVLLIVSSSATIFIASQVELLLRTLSFMGPLAPLILLLLKALPFVVVWVLFSFVYVFMPNTRVKIPAGVCGGVAAGTIYQLTQWVYVTFQIGVTEYGAVYGSFAALPLFLVWLQFSWLIVLLGAEISFAYQNVSTYEFEPDSLLISYSFRRLLTLRMASFAVKRFCQGGPPSTETDFAQSLDIPIRLVRQILFELVSAGIFITVVCEGGEDKAYQPSSSSEDWRIRDVMGMLEDKGTTDIPVLESPELKKLRESLRELARTVRDSPANLRLQDV
ncbi:MAG: YihY/virulence factor BrkB family protein [Elusimicrobia bacterium]|nr:YihY/virulence factor BrkB family protein [Elusimicrobiota bacterium]